MKTQNQDKRPSKILVIGSKGHPREVQCYNWTEIDKVPNIADQDVVIINMTPLTESILEKIISSESATYFEKDYFRKLLASEGQVFVIAVPTAKVRIPQGRHNVICANYWWSPSTFEFEEEEGDTIKNVYASFRRYFNNVKHWNFTLINLDEFPKYIECKKLAQNRYNAALSIKLTTSNGGNFYLLPPPTDVSPETAIDILLEDFFNMKISETLDPDWAKEIKVPGENKIEERIN